MAVKQRVIAYQGLSWCFENCGSGL